MANPHKETQASSPADMIDRLSRFDGPPEEFLVSLLAVQCRLAEAAGGAILRISQEAKVEAVAVYPALAEGATAPVWLAQAAEWAVDIVQAGATAERPLHMPDDLYGVPAQRHLVMIPLRGGGSVRGLGVFLFDTDDTVALAAGRERLELSVSLLTVYEMRLTLQRRQKDLLRLQRAMESMAAVNDHVHFAASAMALCNEVAAGWHCDRVSLGFLDGRYVHLKALSHVEKFSRKVKLVHDIETAMEECLDQDLDIVYPHGPEAVYISRAAAALSSQHGPTAVVSFPLRRDGEPLAVVTVERQIDRPFELAEMEALRLTCDLCTARLADLHERDRWFGARAAASLRGGLAVLIGPRHTWLKVAAVLVFAAAMFLVFAQGPYRVGGLFVVQPIHRRVVRPAFDAELDKVLVQPPMVVKKGDELARLRTRSLIVKRSKSQAKLVEAEKDAEAARAQRKWVDVQKADAVAEALRAEIADLTDLIDTKAVIRSPIDGTVIVGDLMPHIGSRVTTDKVLFEIAQRRPVRAELSIPQEEIADVILAKKRAEAAGGALEGELAATRYPGRRVRFIVKSITPMAEEEGQSSVFKVRVEFPETPEWLWLGMEGVAKIEVGRRSYGWIWTRRLVSWVRMKLWL